MRSGIAKSAESSGYSILEDGTIIGKMGRPIKPRINGTGYLIITLLIGGRRKHVLVHRLVASKYCECKNKDANDVNHKDGNKLNNHKDNLEWLTRRQNANHRLGFEDYMTLTAEDARRKNLDRIKERNRKAKEMFKNAIQKP